LLFGISARGGVEVQETLYAGAGGRIAWEPDTFTDEGTDMGEFEVFAGGRVKNVFFEIGYRYLYYDSQRETDEFGVPEGGDVFHVALRGTFFQIGIDF
jgi:hypothetical protein